MAHTATVESGKRHAAILDLRRLFWKHCTRFSQLVAALTTCENLRKLNLLGPANRAAA
jgi:hypothetical protein